MSAVMQQQVSILNVMQALGMAVVRKRERIAQIGEELDELAREGVFCLYSPEELWQLESVGLAYNFDTGEVYEVRQ